MRLITYRFSKIYSLSYNQCWPLSTMIWGWHIDCTINDDIFRKYDERRIYRLTEHKTGHVCRLLFSNMHITSPLTGLLLWNERGRLHAKRRFLVIAPLNYAHGHAYASAFNRLTRFMCVPPVCHIQIFPWISTWEAQCARLPLFNLTINSLVHLFHVTVCLTPQRLMCSDCWLLRRH